MSYKELIEYMHLYRLGEITKTELACAIAIWQISIGEVK